MLDKSDQDLLSVSEKTFKQSLNSTGTILKSLVNFTTDKKINKVRELSLPFELKKVLNKALEQPSYELYGVIENINTFFIADGQKLYLYKLMANVTFQIDVSEEIRFVRTFIPKKDVFIKEISFIMLICTKNFIFSYGYKKNDDEFIQINFDFQVPSEIKDIKISNTNRIFAISEKDIFEIIYNTNGFSSTFFSTNMFQYFLPVLFSQKNKIENVLFDVHTNFLVVLNKKFLEIYQIQPSITKLSNIAVNKAYQAISIMEENVSKNNTVNEKLLICAIDDLGHRDFFGLSGNIFSKESPLDLDRSDKVRFYQDGYLIQNKKRAVLVSMNDDQFYEYDVKRASENFEIVYGQVLAINKRIFLFHDSIQIYEILKQDSLLKQIINNNTAVRTFCQQYGRKTLFFYFKLIAQGDILSTNTAIFNSILSQLEHHDGHSVFDYRQDVTDIIYFYIKSVYKEEIQNLDNLTLDIIINKLKNLTNFDQLVNKTIDCLHFVQICLDNKFLLTDLTIQDLLYDQKKEKWRHIIKTLNLPLLRQKCTNFLSLDDLFIKEAQQLIAIGTKESLNRAIDHLSHLQDVTLLSLFTDFLIKFKKNSTGSKNASIGRIFNRSAETIISDILETKHFTGVSCLIKRLSLDFKDMVIILSETVKCYGSLMEALNSKKQTFCFAVFEAFLRNEEMFTECICCDTTYNPHNICDNSHSNMFNMKKFNILYINNQFLEPFIKEKLFKSNNQKKYDLYWKWLIYQKRREEGIMYLKYIIRSKKINLKEKLRYLNILYTFDSSVKNELDLATIQLELQERVGKNLDNLLSGNVLFNEYAYKYGFYDLALQILDLSNNNPEIITETFRKYLIGPSEELEEKLLKLNLTGSCKNLDILIPILSKKRLGTNLCEILEKMKFSKAKIIEAIKKESKGELPTDKKEYLQSSAERYYGIHLY
ncbi:Nuclear pore complex, Nup155 component (D Nup154, sc Nup157/Nup170) [Pseudoloma neurophilia]|uniref:Nuclear pore complex, Nup155 component (D Nup154, sc Nup157/Nup170) n=1 Tax=Pseudoloma neurophilia TaxID=146866 RepID=A0A0R0LZA9_9MICR|nr:Nuclear pore complex, Nup155 component (D Nup154, sc Nup157/Nup170) [Pseudoloma neurophilia]